MYEVAVDPDTIYDLHRDPDKIWAKAIKEVGKVGQGYIPRAEGMVKESGYAGYFAYDYKAAAFFNPTKVEFKRKGSGTDLYLPSIRQDQEFKYSKEFHGAPTTFDKFSMDKIGTKGVQVYGWGLYFTNDKAIAEMYASQVPEGWAKKDTKKRVYEVTLAPKEEEYLNLDKPLRKQSKVVKKGINEVLKALSPDSPLKRWFRLNTSKMTGEQLYRWMALTFRQDIKAKRIDEQGRMSEKKASLYLLSKGIRGNKITTIRSKYRPTVVDKVIFSEGDIKIDAMYSKRLMTAKKLEHEWKTKLKGKVAPPDVRPQHVIDEEQVDEAILERHDQRQRDMYSDQEFKYSKRLASQGSYEQYVAHQQEGIKPVGRPDTPEWNKFMEGSKVKYPLYHELLVEHTY